MPLQHVKNIWTGDAEREAGRFAPAVELLGVRPTERLYFIPFNALERQAAIRVKITHASVKLLFLSFVPRAAAARYPQSIGGILVDSGVSQRARFLR